MVSLRKIWGIALDVFFPPICLNCKAYLETPEKDNLICNSCLAGIKTYKTVFHRGENTILMAAAPYKDPTLKELIHYFKYKHFMRAEKVLGDVLTKYLKDIDLKRNDDLLVPIPLHPSKERSRGFNQAEIIARVAAKHLKLPVVKALKRTKKTHTQIDLPQELRAENMKGAFELVTNDYPIKGKSVILVDDIYTTGATMKEAAKVLRKNGVKEVKFLVLAKTD